MNRTRVLVALAVVTSVLVAGAREAASTGSDPDGLVAHEWGTFTTVAGADGRATDWLPLGGPALRGEATLAPPSSAADAAVVRAEMERILIEAGLLDRRAGRPYQGGHQRRVRSLRQRIGDLPVN